MKKKLHDYVELIDFEREYYDDSKKNDNYGDNITVRYTNPDSGSGQGIYNISAGHMDHMDYVAIDLSDESGFQFDSFTGGIKNGDLQNFYKRALVNPGDELTAALVGYYIYKLPKRVRDVKALKLDKETADVWGDIISEL